MERLLLHTCCAPCSVYCVESLRAEGLEPVSFWYNPNIHPYQDHEAICRTAQTMADRYGVAFLYRDFRPGFRQGQSRAREMDLYMQKYCGCVFSEEERYEKQIRRDRERFPL